MRIFIFGLLLIGLSGTYVGASQTSSFQCPNGLVSIGDTREEVLNKCGTPSTKIFTELSPLGGSEAYRERKTVINESHWTYNPGPNGFVYRIEFLSGKVRYIENTEKYGSK